MPIIPGTPIRLPNGYDLNLYDLVAFAPPVNLTQKFRQLFLKKKVAT